MKKCLLSALFAYIACWGLLSSASGQNCYESSPIDCVDLMYGDEGESCEDAGGCSLGPGGLYWWCYAGTQERETTDESVEVLSAGTTQGFNSYTTGTVDIACEKTRLCAIFCAAPMAGNPARCRSNSDNEWETGAVFRDSTASGAICPPDEEF